MSTTISDETRSASWDAGGEISDETRERAAMILQVAISNGWNMYEAAYELCEECPGEAWVLASVALDAAFDFDYQEPGTMHGDAECLLRCGWCPGDVVTRV